MLAADPTRANAKGGPLGWEPLLYACYSRLNSADPHHSTLEVARILLANGADPNDGQTLYNRHFKKNDDHLKLLLPHGLGRDNGGP